MLVIFVILVTANIRESSVLIFSFLATRFAENVFSFNRARMHFERKLMKCIHGPGSPHDFQYTIKSMT